MEQFQVSINGREINGEPKNVSLRHLPPQTRIILVSSNIKVSLLSIISKVLYEANMPLYDTCDKIIKNLHIDQIYSDISKAALESLIFNEILSLFSEASCRTNKEYYQYLCSKSNIISSIADKILEIK